MNQTYPHEVDKFGKQNEEFKKQAVNDKCNMTHFVYIVTTHNTVLHIAH